jgi:NAD(P)-dependent dehydrogenase (short-subunit alcohol dehydrogenase family)
MQNFNTTFRGDTPMKPNRSNQRTNLVAGTWMPLTLTLLALALVGPSPFGEITEELYDSIFDINVKGLLFTVQKALPLLPDGASIILNASIVASKGFSSNSVYSATKAAVRSFARTWTTDLKDRHIRVNAVSPGSIDTPGLSDLLASSEVGEQRSKMISNTVPLGRFGTPDEIAKAVVFLASDDSSYITGTELFVDGGVAQV